LRQRVADNLYAFSYVLASILDEIAKKNMQPQLPITLSSVIEMFGGPSECWNV